MLILVVVACSNSSQSGVADAGDADAGDAGDPPEDVIGDAGFAPFANVAQSAGLPSAGGMCLAFEDFDGDGRPDIFLGSMPDVQTNTLTLYINDGGGLFHAKPLPPIVFASKATAFGGCAVGDVDADGKLDIVVSSFFGLEAHYLRNVGGGAFEDKQTLTPSVPGGLVILAAALADFDGDGWLDLVLAPYVQSPTLAPSACGRTPDGFACVAPGARCAPPPIVFRNGGAGVFSAPVSVTNASDCGPGNPNALAITDWNGDGLPDVFVANDWGTNRFYVNAAGMKFADVWPSFGAKSYNHGMGAAFEDFDLDGKLDFYVSDLGSDQFYLGAGGGGVAAHGVDWEVAAPTRLHSGWAATGEDFDSDGFADVFVVSAAFVNTYADLAVAGASGAQLEKRVLFDVLFHGNGGHGFSPEWFRQAQTGEPRSSFGSTAIADFDGDGRLDIAESVGFPMRFQLLHNVSMPQHWIEVRLKGHAPNLDGIGGTVTLSVPGRPPWKRYVQRTRGTIGASWATLHFGLGAATSVDHVDVRWPDGTQQTVMAPMADAVLTVTEP